MRQPNGGLFFTLLTMFLCMRISMQMRFQCDNGPYDFSIGLNNTIFCNCTTDREWDWTVYSCYRKNTEADHLFIIEVADGNGRTKERSVRMYCNSEHKKDIRGDMLSLTPIVELELNQCPVIRINDHPLQSLEIYGALPPGINLPTTLENLVLSNVSLHTFPTSHFPALETLDLRDNVLHSINLTLNKELTTLSLKSNRLQLIALPRRSLQYLDLSYNRFVSLKMLPSSLRYLNLEHNPLKTLNTLYLSKLEYLNLDYTALRNLPDLSRMPHLQNLTLSHSLNLNIMQENSAMKSEGLKYLHLTNNGIQNLNFVPKCPQLKELNLSKNQISIVIVTFQNVFPNLRNLDLSGNLISKFQFLGPQLRVLDLSGNLLTVVRNGMFNGIPRMEVLNLKGNKLESIQKDAFAGQQYLKTLDLSDNQLSFADPGQHFKIVPKLITSVTLTSKSPLQFCTNLEILNLRNNKITRIFKDWTSSLQRLQILNLSYNQIEQLEHGHFSFHVNQKLDMDLRYNKIRELDVDFLEKFENSSKNSSIVIRLDGNPINCDCHVVPLLIRNVSHNYQFKFKPHGLVCQSPENLRERPVVTLEPKELLCPDTINCPDGCSCWTNHLTSQVTMRFSCGSSVQNFTQFSSQLNAILLAVEPNEYHLKISQLLNDENAQQFLHDLLLPSHLATLDIRFNNLTRLPNRLNVLRETRFWLSENPLQCEKMDPCSSSLQFWKKFRWRVQDIQNITCGTSKNISVLSIFKENLILHCSNNNNETTSYNNEMLSESTKLWIAFLCLSFLLLGGILAFFFFFWKYGFHLFFEKEEELSQHSSVTKIPVRYECGSVHSRGENRILRLQESCFY